MGYQVMKTVNVDVKTVLGDESSPHADAYKLAQYLISEGAVPGTVYLSLSMRECSPSNLCSSFVNMLLSTLEQHGVHPESFEDIVWITKFPRERNRMDTYTSLFTEDALTG